MVLNNDSLFDLFEMMNVASECKSVFVCQCGFRLAIVVSSTTGSKHETPIMNSMCAILRARISNFGSSSFRDFRILDSLSRIDWILRPTENTGNVGKRKLID
jgi:hypothetical protein